MHSVIIFTDLINATLSVGLAYILYNLFGEPKFSRTIRIISCALLSLLFALTIWTTDTGFFRFIVLLFLTFAVSFLFSMKLLQRILYSLLDISLCVISEGITAIVVSKILEVDINSSAEGLFYVLGTIISKFLVLMVIEFVRLKKHKTIAHITFKHIIVLIMVPLSSMLILVLQYYYDYAVALPVHIIWAFTVSYVLLLLSNLAVFDYIDSLYQSALYKSKMIASAEIIKEQEKHCRAIHDHYSDIAKFRHDQKNMNIGILNEIKNGNLDAAVAHLQESISILSVSNIRSEGIIHSVVAIKMNEAEKYGIELNFEYKDLKKIKISDIDIAVLLGNALDNAIEATERIQDHREIKKEINLLVTVQNNNLIIYIKNPVAESIDTKKLRSGKKNSEYHGFGTISMKQIVENLRGDIIFSCDAGFFEVNIVIPNIVSPQIDE